MNESTTADRRTFLAAGAATATAVLASGVHAAAKDEFKVGLIGCGGRGTGAAIDCLSADPAVKVVAVADVFEDNANRCANTLTKKFANQTDIPPERRFVGLDAYQKVLDAGIDLVILATPPGFRPPHLEAAVKAGKHIFTEKPVAVDGPGVRRCLALVEESKRKNLAIGAGTQRRHQAGYLETMKRIHDGAIGDIVAARAYWNGSGIWFRDRKPGMTDLAYQLYNWYHFMWICGDHIVEQHVHNLDVINWAKKAHPIKCMGMGGRSNRKSGDPSEVGNIFDHFAVEYTYPDGSVMQSYCRQIAGCANSISEALVGTKGTCQVNAYTINGKRVANDDEVSPYKQEHIDLIRSIREGKPLNELQDVTESTLTAIMGRMSTYSGKEVKWDEALNSQLDSFPANMSWDMALTTAPAAVVGQTRAV